MTDREMLKLAAKAANYVIVSWDEHLVDAPYVQYRTSPNMKPFCWLPLTDPGDALRLAVALHIDLKFQAPDYRPYWTVIAVDRADWAAATESGPDPLTATMRAITRAAAEIGRTKP